MMNLQLFNNPQFGTIRIVTDDNREPLFCAKDVCKALGYKNTAKALSDHTDKEDVTKRYHLSKGGKQQTSFVTESGLYSLIFGSKLETAKLFKRWVTSEVLPSIRKSGGYIKSNADETPEELMARALAVAKQTIERVERERQQLQTTAEKQQVIIQKAAPKVDYYNKVLQSDSTFTSTQIANALGMTPFELHKNLRDAGIIHKQSGQWLLRMPFVKWGLHAIRTQTYTHSDGSLGTSQYTVWNERGKRFIFALVQAEYDVPQALTNMQGL